MSKLKESHRARIFDEESPVCTLGDRVTVNCYDPDSLKKAFHPLGIYSKCFGLFPCYNFSFRHNLSLENIKLVHILDYCYSTFIFLLLTGGALLCYIVQPVSILKIGKVDPRVKGQMDLDYYVILMLIFSTIFAGVQSLFIFPMQWKKVLHFVELHSNIDKILRFDGRMEERWFAKKVIIYLTGCFLFTFTSFTILFVVDTTVELQLTDYLMSPIMSLALMVLIIPTGLAIFFLHAMKLRMDHFNRKLATILKPFIPSCGVCVSFQDYGNELDAVVLEKNQECLEKILEKMRILHSEIRQLGHCMSCIFGLHLVRDFLYGLVALVLYTYFLIYAHSEDGVYTRIIYGIQAVFIVLKILVIVCFAQMISCQLTCLQELLHKVSLRHLPENCHLQVQSFLQALSVPTTISAAGFFSVNKGLMTSIVASITTYFIILLQFKVNSFQYPYLSNNSVFKNGH